MERKTMIIITIIICSLLYGIIAVGESLFDNPDYKKAKELNRMAEKAFEEGDYDKAYEYSEEAKEYIKKADAYASMLVARNKANKIMYKASKRIEYVNSPTGSYYADLRAKNGHPEPYNVKYWHLGNEVDGVPWQAVALTSDEYVTYAKDVATIMYFVNYIPVPFCPISRLSLVKYP